MKIIVKLLRSNITKEIDLKKGSNVEDLLKKVNLKPDTVIIMHKDRPIPIDKEINQGDSFTIMQVSSGG